MGLKALRLLGLVLLAAAYLPLHRLLDPERTGRAGQVTRAVTELAWSGALWGTLVILGLSFLLAWLLSRDPVPVLRSFTAPLARVSTRVFAAILASASVLCAAVVASVLLGGKPTSVDEMVLLLHAQGVARGMLFLPLPGDPAAWMVQNSFVGDGGWTSVYPPFHTFWIAAWIRVGAPWVAGPVSVGALAAFTFLSLERLLPGRPILARVSGTVVALSPFLLFLGGTHLSHPTAGALAALTLWTLLKARDEGWGWGVAAGAATGAFVCTRPWTGLVVGGTLVLAVWIPSALCKVRPSVWLARRATALVVGGLPFALALAAWNKALYGHALSLGYTLAFGPAHGLGFHTDPWGNRYGPLEALAYTGSDLTLLGSHLLETPLPALAMVGLGLLVMRRAPEGAVPILAWALAGVVANAAYWHHGMHMGPRLLYETGAAWAALWTLTIASALRSDSGLPPTARRVVAWVGILSAIGAVTLLPGRTRSYQPSPQVKSAAVLPDPGAGPSLVFVHGSWSSRVSARLTATGLRRDSVETLLRRNDLCSVDRYARWRSGSGGSEDTLSTDPLPGPGPGLVSHELSPGNAVLLRPGAALDDGCLREAHSDRLGSVELEPLLWQAPPLDGASLVLARDLGPTVNAAVRDAFAHHRAWVGLDGGPDAPIRILGYREGMELLWGGAATLSGVGE